LPETRVWAARITAIEVLIDGSVDLRSGQRMRPKQPLEEVIDRLPPSPIAIEDGLRPPTSRRRAFRRRVTR
jgi:hypothetical protein